MSTRIQIKRGTTTPAGLTTGEFANNVTNSTLYIATTNDNPAGTPTWSAWTPMFVGDINCRAVKAKLVLTSEFPTHNLNVETLRFDIKEPA